MAKTRTLVIRNGRVIDPANGLDGRLDLFISDGRIAAVGSPPADFEAEQEIDASGRIVCPGLIDLCARLREPGFERKGNLSSETAAAARSGITTLCCPPDTDPVIDSAAVATLITRRAAQITKARVQPIGALTKGLKGEQLSGMAELRDAGCIALGNADAPFASTLVQRRAMEYAATFDLSVILRPQDHALKDKGYVHEGAVASRLGLPGIPEAAETVGLARDLALARHAGCRVHFHALSTGAAVRQLQQAQQDRLPVSADVAAHQLHLTELDVDGFAAHCHVDPPLRTLEDRRALRQAVAEGSIAAICSDHQPHEPDAKRAPFPSTAPGISGLETLLPLTLRLVWEGVLELPQAIARLTCGPADLLRLPLGRLTPGLEADICIFDPEAVWILSEEQMQSAGKNSPFLGWEFQGRVTHTLLKGRVVYQGP